MPYEQTIKRVYDVLTEVFDKLDHEFDLKDDLRAYHYDPDEWCIDEILEHITLTSHFLMIVIHNSRDKVLKRAKNQSISDGESDLDDILKIGDPDAFAWIRPEHMEPTHNKPMTEVRELMRQQQRECLQLLADMPNGEGALHQVRMSVQALGKLDIYQWLFFLAQHAHRHQVEIDRIKMKWRQLKSR